MFKKLINNVRDMFDTTTGEGAAFTISFWLILIIGGGSTMQCVGQYLESINSKYLSLYAAICIIVIVLGTLSGLFASMYKDYKETGHIFIRPINENDRKRN